MSDKIKRLFPLWLKRIPYYLFKSPQRQEGVSYTWMVESRGVFSLLSQNIKSLFGRKLQPLSICTGIRNRTDNYLQYVLPSILKMEHQELIEISIYDCGSEDAAKLEAEIRRQWKGRLIFISEPMDFTRSYSFNRAIEQAGNELIFAADADITLPENLVRLCNRYVSKRSVWFPIVFNLNENAPPEISQQNGSWLTEGKGLFASTKAQFEEAGKYSLKYKSWGYEDIDLWLRFFRAGYLAIRTRCKGMFHHWHPDVPGKITYVKNLKQ